MFDHVCEAALERQDLSCMYLAHHELENVLIIIYCYYHVCEADRDYVMIKV